MAEERLREAEADWQPIETAPKEADLLLLADTLVGEVRAGYWYQLDHKGDKDFYEGWVAVETQGLTGGRMAPTHWKPLPDWRSALAGLRAPAQAPKD